MLAQTIPTVAVQRNVHMLVTPSGNVTVQVGADGLVVVDPGSAALAPQVIAAVRTLSDKPINIVINTHLHADKTGANQAFIKLRGAQAVRVMAHENAFNRMVAAAAEANSNTPMAAMPLSAYFSPTRDFFVNGEAIILHHAPAAHTDGDTIVHFRGSDVVSTGDIFIPDQYPTIDLANGGSVNGVIAALNRVLEITVPARYQEGGTFVIPGSGRLCDEADVVEYRDMVTIVRDRVQDSIRKGRTLEQIKAERPTRDYDTAYGTPASPADAFVTAVFRSLNAKT